MLRMPDGMRTTIADRAKRNLRSMNAEIVLILRDALGVSEATTGESLQAHPAAAHDTDQKGGSVTQTSEMSR